jgi:hypothetical protein
VFFRLFAIEDSAARFRGSNDGRVAGIIPAQFLRHVVIDRTGVGHLLGNAEFLQLLDDLPRLYFQLSRQFIDSNLAHIQQLFLPVCPLYRRRYAVGNSVWRTVIRLKHSRHSSPHQYL